MRRTGRSIELLGRPGLPGGPMAEECDGGFFSKLAPPAQRRSRCAWGVSPSGLAVPRGIVSHRSRSPMSLAASWSFDLPDSVPAFDREADCRGTRRMKGRWPAWCRLRSLPGTPCFPWSRFFGPGRWGCHPSPARIPPAWGHPVARMRGRGRTRVGGYRSRHRRPRGVGADAPSCVDRSFEKVESNAASGFPCGGHPTVRGKPRKGTRVNRSGKRSRHAHLLRGKQPDRGRSYVIRFLELQPR